MPDAGGCELPAAPPMAGSTGVVVVVAFGEVAACVAGRAFGGRVVGSTMFVDGGEGTTVVVGLVVTETGAVGRDVGGTVVCLSCTDVFVAAGWSAPEQPAQTRNMATPTPVTTDLRLMRRTRSFHPPPGGGADRCDCPSRTGRSIPAMR